MQKPNIVFLMTDQQRFDAMGCVDKRVITPAIDSLADEGILFDQAICQCPMCVPSRNSMMFGLYPSQTGVRNNGGALLDESRLPGKPLPQILHDAGYFCAGFGKTHWNNCVKGEQGSRRGFDVRAEGQPRNSVLCEEGAVMMDDEDPEGLKAYFDETREFGSGEERASGYIGKVSALPIEHHRDGFITKKCLEFLDQYEMGEKPLFLYFSLIKPHAGFNIPPQFEVMYDLDGIPPRRVPPWSEEPEDHISAAMRSSESLRGVHYTRREELEKLPESEIRRVTLRYWANCTFMDYLIGKVLNKIRDKGLDRNTLFVFVSDHGDMMGERDLRYSKYCLFDGSVRVPMILSGDAIDKSLRGTIDHRPAGLCDIVPTLRQAAGLDRDPRLPGESLLSAGTRRGAFCEFHGGGSEVPQIAPAWMWRNEKYKIILYRQGTVAEDTPALGEMYDLSKDPYEWNNVFYDPEYADIRLRMIMEMTGHVSTAFARQPHGHYRGIDVLRG